MGILFVCLDETTSNVLAAKRISNLNDEIRKQATQGKILRLVTKLPTYGFTLRKQEGDTES